MPTNPKPRLFALLVGIDEYVSPISRLRGCVRDVKDVEQYLLRHSGFEGPQIRKLLNAEANREDFVKAFREHLGQAGPADTVVLHYSGHGTREKADKSIWTHETDEALETIVLHNGKSDRSFDYLFTDKELRFLIHELYEKTKAHIVTIFDCCHSGDNTRNGALISASYDSVLSRRITRSGSLFPKRPWNEFLFGSQIPEGPNVMTDNLLPQGAHIQLAACESDQVAMEVNEQGVFTQTLLKVLQESGGNITYNTLRSRVRQYMRAGFEQTPRVYIPINADSLLHKGFLNREVDPERYFCEAVRNDTTGWQLNAGAIHGVKEDSAIKLITAEGSTYEAKVRKNGIHIDFTHLDVPAIPGDTGPCRAEVTGLLTTRLVLSLENHDATPEEAGELVNELQKLASGGFSFGEEEGAKDREKDMGETEQPDYVLHLNNGDAYLTYPGDPYRPLFEPIDYLGTAGPDGFVTEEEKEERRKMIAEALRHVSRWHFIKNLHNPIPPPGLGKDPLRIEITRILADGTSAPVNIQEGEAVLEYQKVGNVWTGKVKIRITNTTSVNLYVAAAYLQKDFGTFLKFIPARVQLLEPGKSIDLGLDGNDTINLSPGDVEVQYNWEVVREAIKFIVSTVLFDAEALVLDPLPEPLTLAGRDRAGLPKGLVTTPPVSIEGWTTQTLGLVFKNPYYNRVPAQMILDLLEWEETAWFAAGLYTEIEKDEHGFPTQLALKKGLVLPEDERTFLSNAKMWLGNVVETTTRWFKYNKLKKDPSRIRVVAEGDSWFQYPILLKDTLDHLYKRYAIRSFAEAGDTLENYLKKREYVKAIGTEGARFFLVSGGGNDVVGDEFPGFLKKKTEVDPSEPSPERYLNKVAFTQQLDRLEAWYDQMFTELLTKYPDVKILVHSYDYVIPVDPRVTPKKSSWSGKYMVDPEIAIEPQSEREAFLRLILDLFAARLKKLENDPRFLGKVFYVNTFGVVPRDMWYDEIHPTNEGYELVAARFIEKMQV